jgi:hypothetical protein
LTGKETFMGRYRFLTRVVMVGLLALLGRSAVAEADEKPIDFNRQIRPLLSDKCYACHGPAADSREGGFRLDQRDSALGEADSGERPIVPGDPAASEIYVRLTSDDELCGCRPRRRTSR